MIDVQALPEPPTHALLTLGHGRLDLDDLRELLSGAGVDVLVDVRRFPASRRHPHLAGASLAAALPAAGVAYQWEERLGGRRQLPRTEVLLDPWWTVEAFRAYAAHTRSAEFLTAMDELLEGARGKQVAIMCSESVWWRCHRRLIADVALAARQEPVWHLMPGGRAVPHPLAAGARLRPDGLLVWDDA